VLTPTTIGLADHVAGAVEVSVNKSTTKASVTSIFEVPVVSRLTVPLVAGTDGQNAVKIIHPSYCNLQLAGLLASTSSIEVSVGRPVDRLFVMESGGSRASPQGQVMLPTGRNHRTFRMCRRPNSYPKFSGEAEKKD